MKTFSSGRFTNLGVLKAEKEENKVLNGKNTPQKKQHGRIPETHDVKDRALADLPTKGPIHVKSLSLPAKVHEVKVQREALQTVNWDLTAALCRF